jgi:membrane-associated HD superfamily phosphohydrolase
MAKFKRKKRSALTKGQLYFCQAMIQKHGDDYVAMARDKKLNANQKTPKQIRCIIKKHLGQSVKIST